MEQATLLLDNANISLVLLVLANSYVLDDIVKMAISTQLARIKADQVNINSAGSLEKAGSIKNLMVNKGSVLTQGFMTVKSLVVGMMELNINSLAVNQDVIDNIEECILMNTEASL